MLESRSWYRIERPGQDAPAEGLHYRHWRHLVGLREAPALRISWVCPSEFRLWFQSVGIWSSDAEVWAG